MKKNNMKWTYKEYTESLADTGDYSSHVEFTNGNDIWFSNGDEMEMQHLEAFCELLNMMPDLYSVKMDSLEFENCQLKKEIEELKKY
jgi:hypothetical protein